MGQTVKVQLIVNGNKVEKEVPSTLLLADFLRDVLGLTGTHVGCDTGQCGACTILLDGLPVKSCMTLTAETSDRIVTTIEGVAIDEKLHPMQQAFKDCHGLQCGFCTPGMVLAGIGIASRHQNPDRDTIRAELNGNLCRCTGYHNIVDAIAQGLSNMVPQKGGR